MQKNAVCNIIRRLQNIASFIPEVTHEIWYNQPGVSYAASRVSSETSLLGQLSSAADACGTNETISLKTGFRKVFSFFSVPIIAPSRVYSQQSRFGTSS